MGPPNFLGGDIFLVAKKIKINGLQWGRLIS